MSGFTKAADQHLVRSQLWSSQIKEVLEDDIFAVRYVRMVEDFPDGDTLNIPSLGQAEINDYEEGQSVTYTAMATGNFQFTITQYKSSATYISNKYRQDSFYTQELVGTFVPKQARVIAAAMEDRVLAIGPDGQTAADLNTINGGNHRFVGGGTDEVIENKDFARAKFALQKANVPLVNLVAIVDPSVGYEIETQTGLSDVTYNPMWEGIVKDGMMNGTRFTRNIYGFDVYVSNHLKKLSASETINSVTAASGVCNIFFSAAQDVVPFLGHVRQQPTVESDYNKDLQREEYLTIARYDYALYRPENLVTVITDTDQVT